MAKYVKVVNKSDNLVLVGGSYLFPGEQRTVLLPHFDAAKAIYGDALAEVAPAAEVAAEASEKKPARARAAKQEAQDG